MFIDHSMSQRPYYASSSAYGGADLYGGGMDRSTMRSASMSQFNASSYGNASSSRSSYVASTKPMSTSYYSSSRPLGGYASSYYGSLYDRTEKDYSSRDTTYRSPYSTSSRRAIDYSSPDSYRSKPPVPPSSSSSSISNSTRGDNSLAAPGRYRSSITYSNYNSTASSGYSSASSTSSTRSNGISRSASVDRYGLAGGAGGFASNNDDVSFSRYEPRRSRTLLNNDTDPDSLVSPLEKVLTTQDEYSSYGTSRRNYRRPSASMLDSPLTVTSPSEVTEVNGDIGPLAVKVNDEELRNGNIPPPSPSPSMGSISTLNGGKSPNHKKVTFNESARSRFPANGLKEPPTHLKASPTSILRTSPAPASPGRRLSNSFIVEADSTPLPVVDVITTAIAVDAQNSSPSTIKAKTSPICNGDSSNTTISSSTSTINSAKTNGVSSMPSTGIIGLTNIGNTCFMNSVLQCLSHTKMLRDFCLGTGATVAINGSTSKMKGALMKAWCDLLIQLWADTNGTRNPPSITPDNFKSQVQKFAPRFSGYSQQDAQEFLRYVMQGLHEDINRVKSKPKPDGTDIDECLSDSMKAQISWKRYLKIDDSKIVDIFVGQLKSELKCTVCGHISSTFDPFWDLSLPIPQERVSSKSVSIEDCFQALTGEEVLDGDEKPTCERCKTHRKCTKRFIINKFPPYLVLHLKRFSGERYRSRLSTLVQFPLRGLDLGQFTANGANTKCTFNLYGVSNHSGTPLVGHYTAYVKHAINQQWYHYDDSRVSPITDPDRTVCSSDAYVLFYELQNEISRL